MDLPISEEVHRKLITESLMGDLSKVLSNLVKIGKENVIDTQKIMKLDLKFLLTWSATIGGIIGPINQFVRDQNPELTQANINLITLGVCSMLFYNNEKLVSDILSKIKNEGLIGAFESALEKGADAKNAMINFLNSIGVTTSNLFAIASFTFMLPILSILNGYATGGEISSESIQEIAERIAGAGVTALSAVSIRNFLKKYFERVKETDGNEEFRS